MKKYFTFAILIVSLAYGSEHDEPQCVGKPLYHKVVDPERCQHYNICLDYSTSMEFCPDYEIFNYDRQMCVEGVCPPCNIDESVPATCENQPNGIKFQDPEDCQSYIFCDQGHMKKGRCAYAYKYNRYAADCIPGVCPVCDIVTNPPINSTTKLPITTTTKFSASTKLPTTTAIPTKECKGKPKFYKMIDPDHCHGYKMCISYDDVLLQMCENNEIFNYDMQKCVEGKCPPCDIDESTPSSCENQPSGSKFQDPEDCRGYILCDQGHSKKLQCPYLTKFDKNVGSCVVAESCPVCDVVTNPPTKSTTELPITTTTTEFPTSTNLPTISELPTTTLVPKSTTTTTSKPPKPSLCKNLPNGRKVPNLHHCNKYYICRNGNAIPMHCAAGLWFDAKLLYCNFPKYVHCPARVN